MRHRIYDFCISWKELESILVPKEISHLRMSCNPLFLVSRQLCSELIAYIYSKQLHIDGFPLFKRISTSPTLQSLPITTAVFERLRHVEINVHLASDTECPLVQYYSMAYSVGAIKELSGFWAKGCQLQILKINIPTSPWISILDKGLLETLENLSLLRGPSHVELSGPGPFNTDVAKITANLMRLSTTESDIQMRVDFWRSCCHYLKDQVEKMEKGVLAKTL